MLAEVMGSRARLRIVYRVARTGASTLRTWKEQVAATSVEIDYNNMDIGLRTALCSEWHTSKRCGRGTRFYLSIPKPL